MAGLTVVDGFLIVRDIVRRGPRYPLADRAASIRGGLRGRRSRCSSSHNSSCLIHRKHNNSGGLAVVGGPRLIPNAGITRYQFHPGLRLCGVSRCREAEEEGRDIIGRAPVRVQLGPSGRRPRAALVRCRGTIGGMALAGPQGRRGLSGKYNLHHRGLRTSGRIPQHHWYRRPSPRARRASMNHLRVRVEVEVEAEEGGRGPR